MGEILLDLVFKGFASVVLAGIATRVQAAWTKRRKRRLSAAKAEGVTKAPERVVDAGRGGVHVRVEGERDA